MAITFVGSKTATTYGIANPIVIDLTAISGIIEGDIVVVNWGWQDNADKTLSVNTSGYTKLWDLFSNDTYKINEACAYKVMGSTPDTSVSLSQAQATNTNNYGVAYVLRGVDPTTPLDVTPTTATGIDTSNANSPAITPISSGALVLSVMGCTVESTGNAGSCTGPSGYSNVAQVGYGYYNIIGTAMKFWSGSGAEDPGAWSGFQTGSQHSWAAGTVALRPYLAPLVVTTQNATDITKDSFTANGNITDIGEENATRRGFCYMLGTSGNPTVSDSVVYEDGDFGVGAFDLPIT